jgi:hypothetical protein
MLTERPGGEPSSMRTFPRNTTISAAAGRSRKRKYRIPRKPERRTETAEDESHPNIGFKPA